MKSPPAPLPQLNGHAELIDTHCHLDMEAYSNDLEAVIDAANLHGVTRIITIGIDLISSAAAVRLAEQYPNVYATVGIHPHDAGQVTPQALEQLRLLAGNARVVGYGEIGLDYVKNYAPQSVQLEALAQQLSLAQELELPVIIHDREAHEDTLRLLKAAGPFPRKGVMHCFSGDTGLAEATIDLGFYISIPGVATFANANTLREVIQAVDLDLLLLETDGPFLAPVPYRGKRNEPKFMLYTAQMVADLKNIPLEDVAAATTANAVRLFQLPETSNDPR
ncbi:MAG: TatD family hydrolase [Desulfobulbus sp.]|nr:TatD family hydrolase [Desulfobulbus sp.]